MFVVNHRLFDSKNADVIYDALEDCIQVSINSYYVLNNYRRTTKGQYDIVKKYYSITLDLETAKFKTIEKMKNEKLSSIQIEKRIAENEEILRSIVYYALNNKSKAITYSEPFDKAILQSGYTDETCQKGLTYVIRSNARQEIDDSVSYTDITLDAY